MLSLFRRYPGRIFVVFLLNLCSVLLTILVFLLIEPFCKILFHVSMQDLSPVTSFFMNRMLPWLHFDSGTLPLFGLLLLALLLYFLKDFFTYASQWVMASMRSHLLMTLRNEVYDKILNLPIGYFNSRQRGDVVSRAVNDTQEVEHTTLTSLRSFMTDPVTLLIFLVALFMINAPLTIFSLLLMPLAFFIISRMSKRLRRQTRASKERLGSMLSHVEESVGGLRIIKSFNAQRNAKAVFDRLNDDFTDVQTRIYRRTDLASPLSEFLGVTIVMIVLVVGGNMVLANKMNLTAEMFITYIAMFTQVIEPLKSLSTAGANYRRGLAALDRVHELLNADEQIPEAENSIAVDTFRDSLRFDHLTFSYGESPVIRDVSFEICRGEMVALVGASGAGKSTLTDLVERFYDPTDGRILLDGIDIREYRLHDYRSLFALVSQDVVLFNDTLYRNVTMGRMDIPEEEVMRALEVANLGEFVSSLPDGLRHAVGDRGLNLSGGQRQRISIARAVVRNTPILILDEATSAMDTESEKSVQEALDRVMKDRTVLVVAHRLSTIRHADRIIVLENGRVVETGTHEELLARAGVYRSMIESGEGVKVGE
ncbi:MAG: ABC transporter ATP-binding protein/permease [Bacteroidales bacterium]|nr:ABC transporter ATP-binding protein/permease [Bacteroidales bacterium]